MYIHIFITMEKWKNVYLYSYNFPDVFNPKAFWKRSPGVKTKKLPDATKVKPEARVPRPWGSSDLGDVDSHMEVENGGLEDALRLVSKWECFFPLNPGYGRKGSK